MSIEINFERLEQLSIADLKAIMDYAKWYKEENAYRLLEKDKWSDVIHYSEQQLERKMKDIFILD
jgi:hypothetical protein